MFAIYYLEECAALFLGAITINNCLLMYQVHVTILKLYAYNSLK